MFSNLKLWTKLSIVGVLILLIIAATIELPCSKSFIEEMTWRLEFAKSEQESNQSMLYLVDSILEWERVADDFSMHDDWLRRKMRSNNRLAELSVVISDFQNQLDECN